MKSFEEFLSRQKELMEIPKVKRYAIELIIHSDTYDLITEYNQYKKFKRTQSKFTSHPEDKNIPVQKHYHIYPSNSKKEIYAVNMDGTAHHQKNKGYEIPRKEADELRSLGVKIAKDNILENKEISINENLESYISIFIIINE
jgi:hypothetical protein